jgi:secreted trypsin-like serine protease
LLVAAHCIRGKQYRHDFTANDISVLIGLHDLTPFYQRKIHPKKVKKIAIHHDWIMEVNMFEADIAILELEDEVINIQPICLADDKSEIHRAINGTAIGYGMTETGQNALIAKKLNIPIYDYYNCTRFSNNSFLHELMTPKTFCGGPDDSKAVCVGDSGSGVYVQQNGRFYLKGIVSNELPGEINQCDVKKPTIFTDVTRFYDWIKRETNRK